MLTEIIGKNQVFGKKVEIIRKIELLIFYANCVGIVHLNIYNG
jgi:hypothetical protein